MLKTDHGLGNGPANALVAAYLAQGKQQLSTLGGSGSV